MANGRGELVDRVAEAAGQLVTNVMNLDLSTEQKLTLADALERGSQFELITRFSPFALRINVVTPSGHTVHVAEYRTEIGVS